MSDAITLAELRREVPLSRGWKWDAEESGAFLVNQYGDKFPHGRTSSSRLDRVRTIRMGRSLAKRMGAHADVAGKTVFGPGLPVPDTIPTHTGAQRHTNGGRVSGALERLRPYLDAIEGAVAAFSSATIQDEIMEHVADINQAAIALSSVWRSERSSRTLIPTPSLRDQVDALTAENEELRDDIAIADDATITMLMSVHSDELTDLRARNAELTTKLAYWIDRAQSSNRRPLTDAEEEEAGRFHKKNT